MSDMSAGSTKSVPMMAQAKDFAHLKCGQCGVSFGQYEPDLLPDRQVEVKWRVWNIRASDGLNSLNCPSGHECYHCWDSRRFLHPKKSLEDVKTERAQNAEVDENFREVRRSVHYKWLWRHAKNAISTAEALLVNVDGATKEKVNSMLATWNKILSLEHVIAKNIATIYMTHLLLVPSKKKDKDWELKQWKDYSTSKCKVKTFPKFCQDLLDNALETAPTSKDSKALECTSGGSTASGTPAATPASSGSIDGAPPATSATTMKKRKFRAFYTTVEPVQPE